ncbi:MAG: carbohydrate binding family 9 domain-containing protein [Bacteroidales bacterium]|nr:carbohydrate binding family 9 domain-containing protein [Bacteroidales bacterium]
MFRNVILILLLFAACYEPASGQRTIRAFPLSAPISVDGIHEPGLWAGADSATAFVQMAPGPGEAATQPTVAYVGYDNEFIYVSVNLYQDTEVLAKVMNRDMLTKGDDCFALVIDTYNDNRSGYGFWTNPLGTQTDFRINDDGRSIDVNWDTEWLTASVIHANGWTMEMAIPFKSLRFRPGSDTWGINFSRIYLNNLETIYWSGTLSDDFRISQGGKLTGLEVPESKGKLTLFPYGSLSFENNEFTGVDKQVKPDVGGDVKWQISQNITADGTINPDFATVEADQERINLTRYELNYPEKRLFFQEGNEMYGTRIKTFYSRRIEDIMYGAKLNGKAGKYNFNAMNVRTLQMDDEDEPPSFFSTARVKRDFLESSSVGFTAVDKRNDSSFVTSFSGDYVLNLGETWKFTGQFVASVPGDLLSHSAWFVRFAKENNFYHMHVRYTEFGENFRENVNQTGYVVDDDRRELDSDLSYRWWIQNNFFRYIEVVTRNNVFWARSTGVLRSWNINESVEFYLQNRLSLEYRYNNEYKLFDKDYYNYRHTIDLGYNKAEWSYAGVGYSFGHNFDRDFQRFSLDGRVKITEKMAVEYSGDLIKFTPDEENLSTLINVLSLNYNFTNDLWVKLFAQSSTASNKLYFYGMAGWRFKPPFGAVYLIYSHDQEAELMGDLARADAVFLKITLPISIIR